MTLIYGRGELPSSKKTPGWLFEVARSAVPLAAALGGALAIALAARRQRSTEDAHELALLQSDRDRVKSLRDRFTTAAEQLGHEQPAIRLAGAYALASLADDWHDDDVPRETQVCIDLLCAYLRTPRREPLRTGELTPQQAAETEVRSTITSIIAGHLRRRRSDSPAKWETYRFDFTGTDFADGGKHDFSQLTFGGRVDFSRATFPNVARFERTVFEAAATFQQTSFGDFARFVDTRFSVSPSFEGATFGHSVSFAGATFTEGARFREATFGNRASFGDDSFLMDHDAATLGPHSSFDGATFGDGANFVAVRFDRNVTFFATEFTGSVSFENATFAGKPTLSGAGFHGDVHGPWGSGRPPQGWHQDDATG